MAEDFECWTDHRSIEYLHSTNTLSIRSIRLRNILHYFGYFSFDIKYHPGSSPEIQTPDLLSRSFSFISDNCMEEGNPKFDDETLVVGRHISAIQNMPDANLKFFDTDTLRAEQKNDLSIIIFII